MEVIPILMAAGEGTRMRSAKAKVLHEICGLALVRHVLRAVDFCQRPVVVVGKDAEEVKAALAGEADFAFQAQRRGTGHAVMTARPFFEGKEGYALVLAGDAPLLRRQTLQALVRRTQEEHNAVTLLSARLADPTGYGRVLRDAQGAVTGIVEHKDATEAQRAVTEVNASVYCFEIPALCAALDRLTDHNAQHEYYLTDCVGFLAEEGRIGALVAEDAAECFGVNDRAQLAAVTALLQRRINEGHMLAGVTLIDPGATYIDADVTIEPETVVYPGNVLLGQTHIGRGAVLLPHNVLRDAAVAPGETVGPFCLR